jgi:hypothetical protein
VVTKHCCRKNFLTKNISLTFNLIISHRDRLCYVPSLAVLVALAVVKDFAILPRTRREQARTKSQKIDLISQTFVFVTTSTTLAMRTMMLTQLLLLSTLTCSAAAIEYLNEM